MARLSSSARPSFLISRLSSLVSSLVSRLSLSLISGLLSLVSLLLVVAQIGSSPGSFFSSRLWSTLLVFRFRQCRIVSGFIVLHSSLVSSRRLHICLRVFGLTQLVLIWKGLGLYSDSYGNPVN